MKPIAKYRQALKEVVIGQRALVEVSHHPLLEGEGPPLVMSTSPVVGFTDSGFETENTQYVQEGPTSED